jgi:regulator of nonsense transcripts 2
MMAESLDSRKFERKAVFDVPLPIRRGQRDTNVGAEDAVERDIQTTSDTMAFALMTKRGNRQQVCAILSISKSSIP